jgi:hypothetical protein
MPVKSPAATPTTPRKRRTRKTSPTATRKVAKTAKVIKEVQAVLDTPKTKPVVKKVTVTTFKGGKVVAKQITLKRPSTARLISPQKYLKDIQTRWAIHNYEIQELLKDFTKGFEAVKPYHAEAVKTVKAWTV